MLAVLTTMEKCRYVMRCTSPMVYVGLDRES